MTAAEYWPITRHQFIGYDDPKYVVENWHVNSGFTWSGIVWAFTSRDAANWHPLTWLSHMLDCQLYGLAPGGHHLTSLLLHCFNSLLVFVLLKQMTGSTWRSAFVAALFAWHPLHVESVAWAAERKDVLSTCFFLLSIWAYASSASSGGLAYQTEHSAGAGGHDSENSGAPGSQPNGLLHWKHRLSLVFFALALLCKPMVVTLPFVLLLLDIWPLERLRINLERGELKKILALLSEKVPFFLLSLASCVLTYWAQSTGRAVASLTVLPLHARVSNAVLSYLRYLSKAFWPSGLAIAYPYPTHFSPWAVLGTVLILAGVTAWCAFLIRKQPFLIVGWLWFIGTLVPVIGLVQVGIQAMADRYMYIPSIGLFVAVVWGLHALAARIPRARIATALAGAGALGMCMACTAKQIHYWKNGEALFRHSVAATGGGVVAFDELGTILSNQGKLDEATRYFKQANRIEPADPEAHYALGTVLLEQQRLEEAVAEFRQALRLRPAYALAHGNLAIALRQQGKLGEALSEFTEAARFGARDPGAHFNLGLALLEAGKPRDAAASFTEALRLEPGLVAAHYQLALALAQENKTEEAAVEAQTARSLALAAGQQDMAAKASALLKEFALSTPPQKAL